MEVIKSYRAPAGAGQEFKQFVPITKVDDEKHMVFGVATADGLDEQDEVVEWEATKEAVPEFKKWRNLREMHQNKAVGTIPELQINDTERSLEIGAHVVDGEAWNKVKEGVYKGFSIGGKALDKVKEYSNKFNKTISRVTKYLLNEISLVDRPAHPKCVFTMMKRGNDDLITQDILQHEIVQKSKVLTSLLAKVMSDEAIAELPNNKFALVKRYKRDDGIHEECILPIPDKVHAMSALQFLGKMGLTESEQKKAHGRIIKVLGASHDPLNCSYCVKQRVRSTGLSKEELMKRNDVARAKKILQQIASSEESEASVPNEDYVIEDEPLAEATEHEPDTTEEDTRFVQESEEGDSDEGLFDDVDDLTGEADDSLLDRYDVDDARSDEEYEDDGVNRLLDALEEELEGEESSTVGKSCAYCGTTLKLLHSGQFQKNEATCPGCGQLYKLKTGQYSEVSSPASLRKKGNANSMMIRKFGDILEVQTGLADAVAALSEKIDAIEGAPGPRKGAEDTRQKRPMNKSSIDGSEDDVNKSQTPSPAEIQKAVGIRQKINAGEAVPVADRTFAEDVLDRKIKAKVT